MSLQRVLVVGGNGFLGSAICKSAVAKGWEVSSMSSSGTPYTTPAGHSPSWTRSVKWHAASAFDPQSYSSLISSSTAVVHTLGILLEDAGYKKAVRDGSVVGLLKAFAGGGGAGNPLKSREVKQTGYEGMNRDSALTVLDTLLSTHTTSTALANKPTTPFVYISAADAFRPLVPSKYIETKRQAEYEIARRCDSNPDAGIRPIYMRPGLMYHPHIRPLSTLPAFALSLTASLPLPNIFASKSALGGVAESLKTHPLHVDHVAEAVIRCIGEEGQEGVVDVEMMREWAGFVPGQGKGAAALSS